AGMPGAVGDAPPPPMGGGGMSSGMGAAAGGMGGGPADVQESYQDQVHFVLQQGWSKEATELGRWLDAMAQGEWVKQLQQAAPLPVGVVINPRGLRIDTPLPSVPQLRWAGQVLAARALQLQARADHGGALEALVAVLALSRNMKNRTVYVVYLA